MDHSKQHKYPFRAGYSDEIITPNSSQELAGFGYYLGRTAERIIDDLKVRALSLSCLGTRLVLVSCDLLGFTVAYSDRLRSAIASAHSMSRANVLIACTHTHSGPPSQPLEGIGVFDDAYLTRVAEAVLAAVDAAIADESPATISHEVKEIEPIGYDRRSSSNEPLDSVLATVRFHRDDHDIYLVNFACHPVTLGPTNDVTADWPGATVRALEAGGDRALVLQGFSGDINPIAYRDSGGHGNAGDIEAMGNHLAARARSGQHIMVDTPVLRALENHIDLPVVVPSAAEIVAAAKRLRGSQFRGDSDRFYTWWEREALAHREEMAARPFMTIPIQAIAIGNLRIIALPGEAFYEYSRELLAQTPALLTVGYANGNVGYFPTAEAYRDRNDYACYQSPLFYTLFPFAATIESIILGACKSILGAIQLQQAAVPHGNVRQPIGSGSEPANLYFCRGGTV